MNEHRAIRVLQDSPRDGPTNMARDEALMVEVGASRSKPTLRLYEWDPPTISLGYFQPYAEYEALPPPAGELAVVRRATGGGAILHDQELTYSLTLPIHHALLAGGPHRLYELVHKAVMAGLTSLAVQPVVSGTGDDSGPRRGPFFCFERRHALDVLVGGEKIAGSAQRRTRDAILQHGSIIVGRRFTQQVCASAPVEVSTGIAHLRSVLADHLAAVTGECFVDGEWTDDELASVDALVKKYAGDAWTRRA